MKTQTINQYTILYQYLLRLKEPTYIFIIQALQHIQPTTWWEDFIEPVIQKDNMEIKENFKYLDIADLLNVIKMNWKPIINYYDKNHYRFKGDDDYKTVNKVHKIRTDVAHANEIDMSPFIFVDNLSCLLDYAKLIRAKKNLIPKLETDWMKYTSQLPKKMPKPGKEKPVIEAILSVIESKVLLKAVNCNTLPPDIKLSVDRTIMRLRSMRTLDEIIGFFNAAAGSERGRVVEETLRKNNLLGFGDIQKEIKEIYESR